MKNTRGNSKGRFCMTHRPCKDKKIQGLLVLRTAPRPEKEVWATSLTAKVMCPTKLKADTCKSMISAQFKINNISNNRSKTTVPTMQPVLEMVYHSARTSHLYSLIWRLTDPRDIDMIHMKSKNQLLFQTICPPEQMLVVMSPTTMKMNYRSNLTITTKCSSRWTSLVLTLKIATARNMPLPLIRHPQGKLTCNLNLNSSGFTKNSTSGNILSHDIVDVRASKQGNGNTLQNGGNEIFNSGGYSQK